MLKKLKIFMVLTIIIASMSFDANCQNNKITAGNELIAIGSINGKYSFAFNGGSIEVRTHDSDMHMAHWDIGGRYLVVQKDGNLVAYNKKNGNDYSDPVWASNTNGRGNSNTELVIQDDGNVVLYCDGKALWATGTCGGKKNGCHSMGTR